MWKDNLEANGLGTSPSELVETKQRYKLSLY